VAGVPIIRTDDVIGILHVGSVQTRLFDREDLDLLNLVAARVGGALERAQLYEAARAARADASRAADRLQRLQAATAALTGAMTIEEVSEATLREAMGAVQADAGVLAVPSDDGRWLDVVSTMGRRAMAGNFASRFRIDDDASICEAFRTGDPVWVPTRNEWARRFPEGLGNDKPWARSILALPMVIGDQRLGSIGLMFKTEGRLSRDERRLAKTFAEQAALALERARLFEDERVARETTERLHAFASALSAVATSEEVLSILVTDGAGVVGAGSAWAALVDEDTQELHAVASTGYDPDVISAFDRVPLDASMPVTDAVRERREIWFGSFEEFEAAYAGTPHAATSEPGGFGCLPMFDAARGVVGVVSFRLSRHTTLDAPRRSSMRAVAALAAQSLERAKLYDLEHTVAATLQNSLLPRPLPDDRRVTVATRYRPGTQELDVGGDWYDVIRIASDRVGVAIGDVVGHGLDAASSMGQLRSALRSLALTGEGPAAVIQGLDRFARTTSPPTVATVGYAELDLNANVVRYACAGHPPPLALIDGEVLDLMDGRTTPLAALPDPIPCEEGVQPLPSGAVLLLYSDGLIERRGEPLDVGMERLRVLLSQLPADDPEVLADLVLDALTGDVPQDDDVAMLCLRNGPKLATVRLSLPTQPAALADLRTAVRRWLAAEGVPPAAHDDIVLASDEAAANAIEHAYRAAPSEPIEVELHRDDDVVVITVTDGGTWRLDGVEGDRGRGIMIMRAVMDDVDIRTDEHGTVVTLRRGIERDDRLAATVRT